MNAKNSELVIRLDYPGNGCILESKKLTISGWFTATKEQHKALEEKNASIEILLQENTFKDNGYFSNLNFAGIKLAPASEIKNPIFFENFKIKKNDHIKLKEELFSSYMVTADLNFEQIFPIENNISYSLCLSYRFNDQISLSNFSIITLIPESNWNKIYGGFINLERFVIHKEKILLEGWLLKRDESPDYIDIFVNNKKLSKAEIGLDFPEQKYYYPAHPHAKTSRFALYFTKQNLNQIQVNPDKEFIVNAVCHFKNETFEINGPQISWPEIKMSKFWSRIERTALSEEGLLEISGWFVNTTFADVDFFIEGITKRIKLEKNKTIFWSNREEISKRFSLLTTEANLGFVIKIHPAILGSLPGKIQIVAENKEKRSIIGSKKFTNIINDLIFKSIFYRNKTHQALAKTIQIISSIGIRKHWPQKEHINKQTISSSINKIVLAAHNLSDVEGAPKIAYQIIEKIVSEKIKAENVLVISPYDGGLADRYKKLGAKVIIEEGLDANLLNWENYLKKLKYLNSILNDFSTDLFFCSTIYSYWAADYARRKKIPYLWSIQESIIPFNAFTHLDFKTREVFLNTLTNCSKVFFASTQTAELYKNFFQPSAIKIINNGIDLEEIHNKVNSLTKKQAREKLGIKENEILISIVGTTTGRKGQDVFLKEMAELKKIEHKKSFKFFIVGARFSQFLNDLYILTQELGLENEVTFINEMPDVSSYYIASDIMTICSREESSPLVSLEAFAYQRPLVSTTVFGLSEQLTNEENCLTFNLESKGELAKSLSRLINSSDLQRKLTNNAYNHLVEKYQLNDSLDKYLKEILI